MKIEEKKDIVFTKNAAKRVKELIATENNDKLNLRVYITGGGCSGFQYGFTFDENIKDGDYLVKEDGVIMLVDSMSYQYLVGAKVDYIEDLQGARFIIHNPNAKITCGCGSSFAP